MKKNTVFIMITFLIASCTSGGSMLRSDSGTFRGRWYNYYERGLLLSEKADWEKAIDNLSSAVSMRPVDQRMARTYGMNYIDYFPHRELGIAYLKKGTIGQAIKELQESIKQEESSKAFYYLNRAIKNRLLMEDKRPGPPVITISTPSEGSASSGFSLKVKGRVSGEGFVSKILINGMPYLFDLASESIEFEQEVDIDENTDRIIVISEDLLGNMSVKTISLVVDRLGPTITIFDIFEERVGGQEYVRVTGAVDDDTGLNYVTINGKAKTVKETKSYEFDILTLKNSLSGRFVILASDILNNITTAELDLEKELAALAAGRTPVLLASMDSMFSLDEKPPIIILNDSAGITDVYVDRYYVEGEVSDNNRVDAVTVNGRDIEAKKGRKIYFSKVVRLNEGENNINVTAYDTSGNKAQSVVTVKRTIPSAMQINSRMSVSILPFDVHSADISSLEFAYELLSGSFLEQKRFRVIERTKLEEILQEQKLTREKLTDPGYSIKVGRLMAADTILATSVHEDDKSIEFISRIINTETSEVMDVRDVYSEDKSFSSIEELMEGLASKVAGSFPLVKGIVISIDDKYIFTDIGNKMNIKKDMKVIFYRNGKEKHHPLTGKSLGWDTNTLGEGRIEEIHEDFSKAELSGKPAPRGKIVERDMVITK